MKSNKKMRKDVLDSMKRRLDLELKNALDNKNIYQMDFLGSLINDITRLYSLN